MTGVAILEDDETVRNYLAALVAGSGEFDLCTTFASAEEATNAFACGTCDAVELLLCDIELPGKSGIEFIAEMKAMRPHVQFMVLSSFDDSERVFGALKAGASGYVLKNTTAPRLIEALQDLQRGGSPMSSQIARKVVASFQEENITYHSPMEGLSLREREVLLNLSKGHSYKEIAAALFVSVETVRTHVRNIYEKLHVHNRSEAIRKAGLH